MDLEQILSLLQAGSLSVQEAKDQIQGFQDLEFASLDLAREKRNGYPEVVYGEGKSLEQIQAIIETLLPQGNPILTTRVNEEKGKALAVCFPQGIYHPLARCFTVLAQAPETRSFIAVVTAGTSDVPVAEEAAVTAETFGHRVERFYDVGVAGIHRLFAKLEQIRKASVIIAIAGMEGALVSVLAGLVDVPVIAVPTSVGYGSNLQGLTTLMSMLTSCSSGVTVVNIDNGFGAAYSATMINHLAEESHHPHDKEED